MTQAISITTEYQITVSSPVWQRVEQIAGEFKLSVSELLEQIGEGQLKVVAVATNSEKLSYRDIANAFLWLAAQTNVAINVYKLQKLMPQQLLNPPELGKTQRNRRLRRRKPPLQISATQRFRPRSTRNIHRKRFSRTGEMVRTDRPLPRQSLMVKYSCHIHSRLIRR